MNFYKKKSKLILSMYTIEVNNLSHCYLYYLSVWFKSKDILSSYIVPQYFHLGQNMNEPMLLLFFGMFRFIQNTVPVYVSINQLQYNHIFVFLYEYNNSMFISL